MARLSNGENLIALDGIGMSYPGHDGRSPLTVLSDVTLAVPAGKVTVVAGRSGSGKTTLLQVAAGLVEPTAGHVSWFGRPIAELSPAERSGVRRHRIGIVLQSGGLVDWLRADENVALGALPGRWQGMGRGRAHDVLARVGLAERAKHFPAALSGGEQQRVAFARALYSDPEVMIIDEPTAHLDRSTADLIIDILFGELSSTHGILIASHDPAIIRRASVAIELD